MFPLFLFSVFSPGRANQVSGQCRAACHPDMEQGAGVVEPEDMGNGQQTAHNGVGKRYAEAFANIEPCIKAGEGKEDIRIQKPCQNGKSGASTSRRSGGKTNSTSAAISKYGRTVRIWKGPRPASGSGRPRRFRMRSAS